MIESKSERSAHRLPLIFTRHALGGGEDFVGLQQGFGEISGSLTLMAETPSSVPRQGDG